jgi:hypothetical protein
MFYRILEKVIEIEYFWGNFQDPPKNKKALNLKDQIKMGCLGCYQ